MPGHDGTGPMGYGPGSGGGWGPCGQGRGWSARGGRRWAGAAGSFGGFGGHGWRHRFWATGWPGRLHARPWGDDPLSRLDERELLARDAEALEAELAEIKRRLDRFEQPTSSDD